MVECLNVLLIKTQAMFHYTEELGGGEDELGSRGGESLGAVAVVIGVHVLHMCSTSAAGFPWEIGH